MTKLESSSAQPMISVKSGFSLAYVDDLVGRADELGDAVQAAELLGFGLLLAHLVFREIINCGPVLNIRFGV